MPPGVVQLQAKGDKEIYLTESPQMDVFKYNYYRYVNYAAETLVLPLNDNVQFGKQTFCKIDKYGHLLSKLYLHVKLPELTKNGGSYVCWTDNIGMALFSKPIELEIGGVIVDYIYPQFCDMWDDLSNSNKQFGRNLMTLKSDTSVSNKYNATRSTDLIIPIEFWFTKSYAMALPIVAMRNQQIRVNFYFRNFADLINYDGNTPDSVGVLQSQLLAEYIFLDDSVLSNYITKKQTYIVEQIHYQGDLVIPQNQTVFNTTLKFTKPTKEIVFAMVEQQNVNTNNYFVYSRSDGDPLIESATLMLDGSRRFDNLPEFYYRSIVPDSIHSTIPLKYIYCIPFSIRPDDSTQPTGHINMDRFTDVVLSLKMCKGNANCKIYIYGVCYTLVTVENGVLTVSN
ncbi:hypothetical protein EB118_13370 [bacterium]|nr:hypothetical protein [bacterium]NDD83757.1 hypothetical protein [bacterium]NDG31042.1 hypothetical protein [bacterium]